MSTIQGFAPISNADAHTLILGSMPSRESLTQQRYYAHPRNSFWPILTQLLGMDNGDYLYQKEQLMLRGLAIWDVLQACVRPGSLDADIDDTSIISNDFTSFYQQHPAIQRVYFNGAKAESVYRKHVLPALPDSYTHIALQRLPSTSPAHASMTVAEKARLWKVIIRKGARKGAGYIL